MGIAVSHYCLKFIYIKVKCLILPSGAVQYNFEEKGIILGDRHVRIRNYARQKSNSIAGVAQ